MREQDRLIARSEDGKAALIIVFVFIGVIWFFSSFAHAAPCAASAVLDLCYEDELGCKRLYETRGIPFVDEAIHYHRYLHDSNRSLPYNRFAYKNADVFDLCADDDPTEFVAGPEGSAAVTKLAIVHSLVYYGGILTRAVVVCSDPSKVDEYDPETGQSRCVCKPGHVCVEDDDSSAATLSAGYIFAIVACTVLAVFVVVFMIGTIHTTLKTVTTLREIMDKHWLLRQ